MPAPGSCASSVSSTSGSGGTEPTSPVSELFGPSSGSGDGVTFGTQSSFRDPNCSMSHWTPRKPLGCALARSFAAWDGSGPISVSLFVAA